MRSRCNYGTAVAFSKQFKYLNLFRRCINTVADFTPHQILSMTTRPVKLQEDTHFRIMRILQDNPDLTQRELADQLGMSVGGLNYCLKALIDKGLVKMQHFKNSKNKFKYVYLLTPLGMAEKIALTTYFLERKMSEYKALKLEIDTLKLEAHQPKLSVRVNSHS